MAPPQERHQRRFPGARANPHSQPEQCGEPGPCCSNPRACSGGPCQLWGHPLQSARCHPSAWPGHPVASLARSDRAALDGRRHGALRTAARLAAASSPRTPLGPSRGDSRPGSAGSLCAPQGFREFQEEVHGVEDVHLHSVSDELGLLGPDPRSSLACCATPAKPCKRPANALPRALDSPAW